MKISAELRRVLGGAAHLTQQYLQREAQLKVLHYRFRNWGDAINPSLVEMVSGCSVQSVDIDARSLLPLPRRASHDTLYAVVGSIVHHADCQTVIWGAGLQSPERRPKQPPQRVLAVRGPLTAAALRSQGIACPDVFGDPVLLLPRYYRPEGRKRYRLGIIPHISDLGHPLLARYAASPELRIIDLRGGLWSTVNQLCECEHVVSSSLHGLILADAYGVPSARLRLGQSIPGGDFKFKDYYASLGELEGQAGCSLEQSVEALCEVARHREIRLDLEQLLEACPFRWSSRAYAAAASPKPERSTLMGSALAGGA